MENFFYSDKFYSDLDDLCDDLDLDEAAIQLLDDTWSIEATESTYEPIVELSADYIAESIDDDRWPEEKDDAYRAIIKLLGTIDYAAINAAMPHLYYDTMKPFKITKADLIEDSVPCLKPGDYVSYIKSNGARENGRIKSVNGDRAYVVYNCSGEWERFEEYTAASTEITRLSHGWVDGDEPKEAK